MKKRRCLILMLGCACLLAGGCSCETWSNLWGEDPDVECASHWRWKKAEPVSPCAAAAVKEKSVMSYPVTGPWGSAIRVEKMAPKEVGLNAPFEYQIKVTNLTGQSLQNVMVKDYFTGGLKFRSSEPKPSLSKADSVHWDIGALEAKAVKMITIDAVAEGKDFVTSCAEVSYDSPICAEIKIVEPKLKLAKFAPSESLKCDRIPVRYLVTNIGNGYACGLQIRDSFPAGLMTAAGEKKVVFAIDSLAPGDSKEFKVVLDPQKTGRFSSKAILSSDIAGEVESNLVTTMVNQPVLSIKESCPAGKYIGQSLDYEITVINQGDCIARDIMIEASVPENARFNSATDRGSFTHASPGKVRWNIGALEPKGSKNVSMKLSAEKSGKFFSKATANAYCAEMVSTSCETILSGISAILLEVVDVSDPIMLGEETTYIITVTNQGSADATGVAINCYLEGNMEYVSSSGQTMGSILGDTISFSPLVSLAPKARAMWHVNIKATNIGDSRFRVTMNSKELTRPVEETEATKFYK